MVETVYCVHCGAVAKHPVRETVDGQVLTFCCRGCLQVYELMREEGLATGPTAPAGPTPQLFGSAGPSKTITLPIAGMTCANCVAHVERGLRSVPGVLNVSVDLASGSAKVETIPGRVTMADMQHAVEHAGYEVTGVGEA